MIRSRKTSAVALAAAAVLALAAAGCGGSDSSGDTTAAAPTTSTQAAGGGSGGASTVSLTATDFKFNPADPTTNAGEVTFDMSNEGQTVHSLEVEGPNGDQELNSDVSPGQNGTMAVDLSKPGKYEFYCPIGNHKQLGMKGEITVK